MTLQLSTREAYGEALAKLASRHPFCVFDADLSKATQTCHFAQENPHRFFNMGISEGDMMTTAAGMAACGHTVFASTFALFATGRAYEQVRNSIAYPGLDVKIAASHGGVLIGEDGATHQCFEDLALMRVLPNMLVLAPCDEASTHWAVAAALQHRGPVYLRLNRHPVPAVYTDTSRLRPGHGEVVRQEGAEVAVLAHGDMVWEARQAAGLLKNASVGATVVDMHTIKPLDAPLIARLAGGARLVVTVEDHSIIGGLGSAVAEVLAQLKDAPPLHRMGIPDCFGLSGTRQQLAEHFGLHADAIAQNILKTLAL